MSAQPGQSITLDYRPQPAEAQHGAAVVLDYAASAELRRLLRSGVRAPWVAAQASASATRAAVPAVVSRDTRRMLPWRVGRAQSSPARGAWGVADTADRHRRAPWGVFGPAVAPRTGMAWGVADTADTPARVPWGAYTTTAEGRANAGWRTAWRADEGAALPWGIYTPADQRLEAPYVTAQPLARTWELPWVRYSRVLNPGWGIPIEDNTPPTNEDGTVLVPILRTYIMLNNVSLIRVSNGLALPALSLDVRIDSDSWAWGWSASLPAAHLGNLEPDSPGAPVELEASINGQTWRLFAERISRDRRFGRDRISVSGRGIAAEVADPLYPAESRDNTGGALTAQQLAAAALTINGVPLGWALSWQLADWLVPAGAWVHTGTPIEAVARIAQAAGGYVQADPVERTLHVLARYPVLPWEWGAATPDFILPSAATTREATEYVSRPDYNAVYVSGTDIGGVLGHVVKTGTAGDQHAEMVVDALITHADAARGRGGAILGDTGAQAIMTLETPVLDTIGTYPVGALIEWQEGADSRRGIVRSLRVAAELPRVRQTVEVETHG